MEQSRELRSEPLLVQYSETIFNMVLRLHHGERIVSLEMILGEVDLHLLVNEIGPSSYTTHM